MAEKHDFSSKNGHSHEHSEQSGMKTLTEVREQLTEVFSALPHPVTILLFAQKENTEPFSQAAREITQLLDEISPKITLHEYDISHPMAEEWDITHSPTMVFGPDTAKIRWMGAPLGEEGRTMVEMITLLSGRKSQLSKGSLKILERIKEPRQIKLFVSMTCPYCPQQASNAIKAAIEKPDLVSLDIIDIQANPDIAEEYSALSVPQTYVNEKLIAEGAQPEELFV
ncbi:thioredoxin family protein, partial [Acidobacteriota bacterium]